MRTGFFVSGMAAWIGTLSVGMCLWAADREPPPAPPLAREAPSAPLNYSVPAERAVRMREYQARPGAGLSNRLEWEKRRGDWHNLTPEERETRLREWREHWSTNRLNFRNMSAEEREAKRQEMRDRFDRRFKELRRKKAAGTLTAEEQRRLDRMEEIFKRFKPANPDPESRGLPDEKEGKRPHPAPAENGRP